MPACPCPVLPDLSEATAEQLDKITGSPLRCVACGEELELRCPQGHVHVVPRTLAYPRADKGVSRPHKPHGYKRKQCTQCGTEFQPNGGRDTLCVDCKAKRLLRPA